MRVIRTILTLIVSLAAGVAGILILFPLALAVPDVVVVPLALGFGALLAGLAASWGANALASGRTRSRLVAIVLTGECWAIIAAVAVEVLGRLVRFPFGVFALLVSAIGLAVIVTVAAWRLRAPQRAITRDVVITLEMLGAAIIAIAASVAATCSLTPCIP